MSHDLISYMIFCSGLGVCGTVTVITLVKERYLSAMLTGALFGVELALLIDTLMRHST